MGISRFTSPFKAKHVDGIFTNIFPSNVDVFLRQCKQRHAYVKYLGCVFLPVYPLS